MWYPFLLTSLRPRFSLPGLKIVTSNLPLYDDVHPFGGPSLGLMSSVTAWGTAKAVAARARRAREVRIVMRCVIIQRQTEIEERK